MLSQGNCAVAFVAVESHADVEQRRPTSVLLHEGEKVWLRVTRGKATEGSAYELAQIIVPMGHDLVSGSLTARRGSLSTVGRSCGSGVATPMKD